MKIDHNVVIGERVRFYRTSREFSLEKVSNLLATKITAQQLARYETGKSRWPADLLCEIAVIFSLDIRLLTGLEDGRHEGKDNDEWRAEKYKSLILRMPEKARKTVYEIIDDIDKFVSPEKGRTGGESAAEL